MAGSRVGADVVTLDSSALFALANARDRYHDSAREALGTERRPFLVPAGILAEAAYLVEHRLGSHVLDAVLESLEAGDLTFECGDEDFPRIRALTRRYADLPLGFADAAVIGCAERHGGRVLSFDRRDFGVVAREGTIVLVPE